jgi:hypothetical protein
MEAYNYYRPDLLRAYGKQIHRVAIHFILHLLFEKWIITEVLIPSTSKRFYLENKYILLTLYPRRGSRDFSDILSRRPRFTKTIYLWVILNVIYFLVAFYDIHGRKREVLFFYFVPDTTWDFILHLFFVFFLWLKN